MRVAALNSGSCSYNCHPIVTPIRLQIYAFLYNSLFVQVVRVVGMVVFVVCL